MATISAPSPIATMMPRTSEVLWDGNASLPFVLKRKRNGAILVTKLKAPRAAARGLRLGSELKLVGGFPVQQLTLGEVKKVMLHAPKPVSLVFLNHDDVVLDNMSFLSEERGSFENEFAYDGAAADLYYPPLRESSEWASDDQAQQPQTPFFDTYPLTSSSSSFARASSDATMSEWNPFDSRASSALDSTTTSMASTDSRRRRRRSPDPSASSSAPPRKVSRLKLALERMNELLNRPVRRSGLNVAAGKSIVV